LIERGYSMTAVVLQFPLRQTFRPNETTLGLSHGAIDLIEEPNGRVTVDAVVRASIGWEILALIQSDDRNEIRLLCRGEEGGESDTLTGYRYSYGPE
jgi:hypothetical protein